MDRGKISVAAFFAVLGMVCAGNASAIPEIKETLSLSNAELGFLMLAGPTGTGISYLFAGMIVSRRGGRFGIAFGTTGYMLAVAFLGSCFLLKPPLAVWILAMAIVPAFGNILNISINTQGGLVERRLGKSVMGFFHGNWSLANLLCGLTLLALSSFGVPIGWRLIGISCVCSPFALLMFGGLDADGPRADGGERKEKALLRPDLALIQLGLVALLFLGCEGAVFEWVGVFYKDVIQVVPGLTMLGYCSVIAMMTVGRFMIDRMVNMRSATFVFRLCSFFVSVGLALAALFSAVLPFGIVRTLVVTLCWGVAGFGLSGLSPMIYSSATRSKALPPASAVTVVSSIGFIASFLFPPLVGTISDVWGLGIAFAVCAVLALAGLRVRMR